MLPAAGQRSSTVRYCTTAHTSKLVAGWPSRRSRTRTVSDVFCGGVGSETLTLVPAKRSTTPGRGVAVGTAGVGAPGVALADVSSTRRLFELVSGNTFW